VAIAVTARPAQERATDKGEGRLKGILPPILLLLLQTGPSQEKTRTTNYYGR
jgi:hypothetical protein